MIASEFKLVVRRLIRSRGFVFINVVGLSVGLASCAFIAVYLMEEFSYENFHEHGDRIVRIVEDQASPDRINRSAMTYAALAAAVEADLPLVEDAVRMYPYSLLMGTEGGTRHQETNLLFVDSTFFDVFTFKVIAGDLDRALDAPYTVALTARAAERYFGVNLRPESGNVSGAQELVGEIIRAVEDGEQQDFVVTAVIENPPQNTHLQFDLLASFASARWLQGDWLDDPQNWVHPPMYTYALLREGATIQQMETGLASVASSRLGAEAARRTLRAEYLKDIRLYSGRQGERVPASDISYVYLFGAIALMILVLACINFGNLTAAGAINRTLEVTTRKALGARRAGLVMLFALESILVVVVTLFVVALLLAAFLPTFNELAGKQLRASDLMRWEMVVGGVGTALLIGAVAGMWPAIMISREPGSRAAATGGRTAGRLRRLLVVFQFTVSAALILGTLTVRHQIDYVTSERLGFDKERVVLIPLRDSADQVNNASLLDVVREIPGVATATASSGMPGLNDGAYDWVVKPKNGRDDSLTLSVLTVDPDYAETYGLDILTGRDFDREFVGDASGSFLVNEQAAARMGWTPDEAIGQTISVGIWYGGPTEKVGQIVGVVRNFQYHSLHRGYEPLVLHMFPGSYYYDYVSVRIVPGAVAATLPALERVWKTFNPDRPFESRFLDEQFDALYRTESRLSKLIGVFSVLAMIIAGLGLFGLAALTADRRTKELGIRKVFGASTPGLFGLLWGDLLRPVVLALLVAVPLTMLLVDRWLSGFAEQVQPSLLSVLITALLAVGVSFVAVVYHAIRAAVANPIDSLRYE